MRERLFPKELTGLFRRMGLSVEIAAILMILFGALVIVFPDLVAILVGLYLIVAGVVMLVGHIGQPRERS